MSWQMCGSGLRDEEQAEGIVIAGAFGAGKSHQLGYLGILAQQEHFVVSLVPISKETPLFDPARLFAAAIRAAAVPDAVDDVMTAVMTRLHPNSDRYEALEYWTTAEVRAGRLSPLFSALLHLIPRRTPDPDDHARIARFFAGGKLAITLVRSWLREAGATGLFDLKQVREADLWMLLPRASRVFDGLHVYYFHELPFNSAYMGDDVVFAIEGAQVQEIPGGGKDPIARVTAHALGNLLGLRNVEERRNLMGNGTSGIALTGSQAESASKVARTMHGNGT